MHVNRTIGITPPLAINSLIGVDGGFSERTPFNASNTACPLMTSAKARSTVFDCEESEVMIDDEGAKVEDEGAEGEEDVGEYEEEEEAGDEKEGAPGSLTRVGCVVDCNKVAVFVVRACSS